MKGLFFTYLIFLLTWQNVLKEKLEPVPEVTVSENTVDDDLVHIYNGEKNLVESLGPMEFEAVNILQRESQIDKLGHLIKNFQRVMSDMGTTLKSSLKQFYSFAHH